MSRFAKVSAARNLATAIRLATRPGSPSLRERLVALPRLAVAVRRGQYTGVSAGRLALIAAGVAYIVSPVDLMPESLLLVLGLADDAMVLSWLAATLVNETEQFLAWERGVPAGAGAASSRAAHQTVPGETVSGQGPPRRTGG